MGVVVSENLRKEAEKMIADMAQNRKEKAHLNEKGFFITTRPENEPPGTLFLETIKKNEKQYTICHIS